MTATPSYSFVIPVYNEEETLPALMERLQELAAKLDGESEFVFIDDGSVDRSFSLLKDFQGEDPRIRVLSFSRNFGHQIAITAGMDVTAGDAVIIMDADLQDPPEVVLEMVAKWKEGYEVVYAKRISREGETFFKKLTATLFYRVLGAMAHIDIPPDTGDFRLVDARVINAFNRLRESDRFVRGMFSWVGFKHTAVEYHRHERYAGETKYPLKKMVKLAFAALLGFSDWPIRMAVSLGAAVSGVSFIYAIYVVAKALITETAVPGWSSLISVVSFLGGLQLLIMGMLGLYIGRIYEEAKGRPLYIVSQAIGFEQGRDIDRGVVVDWACRRDKG